MPCTHEHKKADCWTEFSAISEGITSFVSDSYWFATILDIATGFTPEAIGLSYYGIGIGLLMGALSSAGSAYCHRILNQTHQASDIDTDHINTDSQDIEHQASDIDTDHINTDNQDIEHQALTQSISSNKLTVTQKLALVGDFISHTTDIASPLTFVITLAGGSSLSRWEKGVAYCTASFFGSLSSVANVRTCKHAMEDSHSPRGHH